MHPVPMLVAKEVLGEGIGTGLMCDQSEVMPLPMGYSSIQHVLSVASLAGICFQGLVCCDWLCHVACILHSDSGQGKGMVEGAIFCCFPLFLLFPMYLLLSTQHSVIGVVFFSGRAVAVV